MQKTTNGNKPQTSKWILAATIIGIISSIVVPTVLSVREQQSKAVTLWIVTSHSLLTSDVQENLTILFNENAVELPWVYTIRLTNTGSLPIESRDVEKPLTLTFPKSRIVHAEIATKQPHDVQADPIHNSNELVLSHGLLNSGDWFEANVLFDGRPSPPAVSYRVMGLDNPPPITESQSGADAAFMPWLPAPARFFVIFIASLCVVGFFGFGLIGIMDAIAPLLKVRKVLSHEPVKRILSVFASGEISDSLRNRIAIQVRRALPSELKWDVEAIIKDLPPNEFRNDPNVLVNQILQYVPEKQKERMQAYKEVLAQNLNLKVALAHEIWEKLPPPVDDQARDAIISARFDSKSENLDNIVNSIRESLSKIPIKQRVDWFEAADAFTYSIAGVCLAILTIESWRLLY